MYSHIMGISDTDVMSDISRQKLIEKATKLLKLSKAKMPDFDKMNSGDLISFIRSLKSYMEGV